MLWLAVFGGIGYAGWLAYQGRDDESPAPEWPPLDPPDANAAPAPMAAPTTEPVSDAPPAAAADARWMPPVDGQCPDGFPIKANANSGIFHMPGGRFYDRTVPERCYAEAADAEADGYRRAKA